MPGTAAALALDAAINAQLAKHRVSDNVDAVISDNVDAVKVFLSTLQRALVKERHFALVDAVCFANHRLAS
jgi:hypothetical protein